MTAGMDVIKRNKGKWFKLHTLHWLLVALHLSAAKPHLNRNVAASAYLWERILNQTLSFY